ncbi:MAG: hypothetical protein D5R97_03130 [Candidatus Syntrophonatronum acetioxidans]|uniref:EXLDI protein n=1 Tax=Candidatus Syntrophonatronum acetioxidans TaxID=1795816 RepID=A0A424YGL4_9FIRM|nr:MAG: hypothetical protein D5R97_03130 [Candidatus Syntrophonatronum acetioxidans]
MARKNFYVKETDLELFEKAEKLAGEESLSATIVEAVRQFVARKEAESQGMEEHTLEVGRWSDHDEDTHKVKFIGRLLASGRRYTGQTSDRKDRGQNWEIYQTVKGKFIIWLEEWSAWQGSENKADYAVLDELPGLDETPLGEKIPGNVLEEAGEVLGREVVKWID